MAGIIRVDICASVVTRPKGRQEQQDQGAEDRDDGHHHVGHYLDKSFDSEVISGVAIKIIGGGGWVGGRGEALLFMWGTCFFVHFTCSMIFCWEQKHVGGGGGGLVITSL